MRNTNGKRDLEVDVMDETIKQKLFIPLRVLRYNDIRYDYSNQEVEFIAYIWEYNRTVTYKFGWYIRHCVRRQYRIRWQCRKFLQGMEQAGPVSMKLKYVELDQKSQEFYCRYSIKGDGGFTKENLKDFLLVKDLAEKLLVECGEIPATYKIDVEIRGEPPSYVENITFGNRDIYKKLEPQRSNGYQ